MTTELDLSNIVHTADHPTLGKIVIELKDEHEAIVHIGEFSMLVDNGKGQSVKCECSKAEVYVEYRTDTYWNGWYPRVSFNDFDLLMSVTEVERDNFYFFIAENRRALAHKVCSWLNENWRFPSERARNEMKARRLMGKYLAYWGDRMRAIEEAARNESKMDEIGKELTEKFGTDLMVRVNRYLAERSENLE